MHEVGITIAIIIVLCLLLLSKLLISPSRNSLSLPWAHFTDGHIAQETLLAWCSSPQGIAWLCECTIFWNLKSYSLKLLRFIIFRAKGCRWWQLRCFILPRLLRLDISNRWTKRICKSRRSLWNATSQIISANIFMSHLLVHSSCVALVILHKRIEWGCHLHKSWSCLFLKWRLLLYRIFTLAKQITQAQSWERIDIWHCFSTNRGFRIGMESSFWIVATGAQHLCRWSCPNLYITYALIVALYAFQAAFCIKGFDVNFCFEAVKKILIEGWCRRSLTNSWRFFHKT